MGMMRVVYRLALVFLLCLVQAGAAWAQTQRSGKEIEPAKSASDARLVGAWIARDTQSDVFVFGADHSLRMAFKCGLEHYLQENQAIDEPTGTWRLSGPNTLLLTRNTVDGKPKVFESTVDFNDDGSITMHNKAMPAEKIDQMIRFLGTLPLQCPEPPEDDGEAWNTAIDPESIASYNIYLKQFPRGFFAPLAVARIFELRKQGVPIVLPKDGTPMLPVALTPDFTHCKPEYPENARMLEEEGAVKLRVKMREDASVESVDVVQSSGFDLLDQTAATAVKTCKFELRRTTEGKPVAGTFEAVYSWVLED